MADGVRKDGPKAEEMLQIIAKGIDQPVEIIRAGITYADREARLDFEDIKRQIAWHRKQGLIERDVDVDALLDKRFVVEVPK
jgi:ABC-type nitrate/sulfonate/bicarbonate transport system substrate-binding protein